MLCVSGLLLAACAAVVAGACVVHSSLIPECDRYIRPFVFSCRACSSYRCPERAPRGSTTAHELSLRVDESGKSYQTFLDMLPKSGETSGRKVQNIIKVYTRYDPNLRQHRVQDHPWEGFGAPWEVSWGGTRVRFWSHFGVQMVSKGRPWVV